MGKRSWLVLAALWPLAQCFILEDSYLAEITPRSITEVRAINSAVNSADAGLLSKTEVDTPAVVLLSYYNRNGFLRKMRQANLTVNFLDLDKIIQDERDEIDARKKTYNLNRYQNPTCV